LKKPHAIIGLLAGLGTAIGVLVAVVGLPYGRLNYTAFAGLYHGGTPAPGIHTSIDCASGGLVQDACTYANTDPNFVTDIVVENNTAGWDIAALQFTVRNPDETTMNAITIPDALGVNGNPDFDEAGPGSAGTWNCSTAGATDDDLSEANPVENSFIGCFISAGAGPAVAAATPLRLADLTYDPISNSVHALTLKVVVIGDNAGGEVMSCNPTVVTAGQCFGATVTIEDPPAATSTATTAPTNTFTPTATATTPPPGPIVRKIPEGCQEGAPPSLNVDCDIPAANLFICLVGLCDGPGEGNLIVFEYAQQVTTQDNDLDTDQDGLGAYEFDVEYDNFVIVSLNPQDIVFNPGPISPYPNGADLVADGEGAARAPATCGFSVILENIIHFGCVTTGPTPDGPLGDFDLARLNLIPHGDLPNDLFPGNDNGVLTVIKDNGCELVDVFGHPVLSSVGGGLTTVCGDLAVTIRILEGDLDLDCDVDLQDQQLIAFRYGSFFGSLLYSQWYDLEPNLHDLDIDIKDLQKVFGRTGSDCQNPIPMQTPAPPPAPFG
jgi:hypothetical protein